jgi:hypothetical protein
MLGSTDECGAPAATERRLTIIGMIAEMLPVASSDFRYPCKMDGQCDLDKYVNS